MDEIETGNMSAGKFSRALCGEFTGWKSWEISWLALSCFITSAISILMKDTITSNIAAVTGMLYTVIAGKGKRSCYFFGIINCICYALISMEFRLYGEVMLYGGYYLPMMITGFFLWNRKLDKNSTIIKTRLAPKQRRICFMACVLGIFVYGFLLKLLNGRTPGLDSATNVLSAVAMILTMKRCIEQWYLWFAVNVISIVMWFLVWRETGEASAIICMYLLTLSSGIIYYFEWRKEVICERNA